MSGDQWWLHAPALLREIPLRSRAAARSARYRVGQALLEVDSNWNRILESLLLHWGDCMVSTPVATDARVRCTVREMDGQPLALVSFEGSTDPDGSPIDAERFKDLRRTGHRETPAPVPGWNLSYISKTAARPFMASSGYHALIDLLQEPLQQAPGFLYRLAFNAAVCAQRDTMFVHAASVGIDDSGVLLVGPAASGKTTVSFALALRGHAFLGDEIACIRLRSGELLPLRRTPGVRAGPRASGVDDRLRNGQWETEVLWDGTRRTLARISQVFPESPAGPTRLGYAFYLRSLGQGAAAEEFRPDASDPGLIARLSQDQWVVYGVTPGRRVMRLLGLLDLLSTRRCYYLDVGSPEETAELIEDIVEKTADREAFT